MTDKASWDFAAREELAPGRYALDKLGGGKRYEVYLAWDEALFSQVVVKVVRPDQANDPKAAADLRREVDLLDALSHPMLVRSFGVVVDGPRPHVVLEHFEGPTLGRLIKGYGPLPLEQYVPLAVRLCGVVHYLATRSVVHLDVKPSNIVMEAPPKVIDLSVARTVEAARKLKRRVGTRKYMAPEQIVPNRTGSIGPATDVWGVGATLYEAVAGRRPFDFSGEGEHPQLEQQPFPLDRDVPTAVAELILACLRKRPEDRPEAADVARGFEPLLEEIPERPRLRHTRPKLR